jgi:hypothetical protein
MSWFKPRVSRLLLGIWLIAHGVVQLVPAMSFAGIGTVLALLAIITGALILMDR